MRIVICMPTGEEANGIQDDAVIRDALLTVVHSKLRNDYKRGREIFPAFLFL